MKTRVEKANPFALIARAKKVAGFIHQIERAAKEEGVPAWKLPDIVDRWEFQSWETARVLLGHRTHPSDVTKSSVVSMLVERARAR